MTENDIIYEEAESLVQQGVYDNVGDAWDEARAICLDSDAFERLWEEDEDW